MRKRKQKRDEIQEFYLKYFIHLCFINVFFYSDRISKSIESDDEKNQNEVDNIDSKLNGIKKNNSETKTIENISLVFFILFDLI